MKHLKILFALSLLPAASAVSAEALDRASDFVGNSERTKVVAGDGCLQVKDSPFYVFTVKRFPRNLTRKSSKPSVPSAILSLESGAFCCTHFFP